MRELPDLNSPGWVDAVETLILENEAAAAAYAKGDSVADKNTRLSIVVGRLQGQLRDAHQKLAYANCEVDKRGVKLSDHGRVRAVIAKAHDFVDHQTWADFSVAIDLLYDARDAADDVYASSQDATDARIESMREGVSS